MMATTHTDVMGMLGKLSPLRRMPRDIEARFIAHRWEVLKPFALIRARQALDPAESFAFLKARHVEYLTRLQRALISPEVIVKHALDDPCQTSGLFEQRLAEAVERRRARLGRVKGRVKPPPRVHKSNRKDTK